MLLAAVTAIGPFAMHLLAPALPWIASDLEVPAAVSQLMLSLSLVAMAVFNLIWGPLSDRYGRTHLVMRLNRFHHGTQYRKQPSQPAHADRKHREDVEVKAVVHAQRRDD